MGIVATLAGSLLLGKISQAQREEWQTGRNRTIKVLQDQIEEIINNAKAHAQEIARYEIVPFLELITERINSKLHFTRLTIELEKSLLGDQVANLHLEKARLENRKKTLARITGELLALQGALT
jgi:hypothetical protein